MRVLVVKPLCKPEIQEIDGSLESMQNVVDGYIQIIYPFDDPVAVVLNEEGKILGLQPNRSLQTEDGQPYDILCGTFFLCGVSQDSSDPDLIELTSEQIKKYSEMFQYPEMFFQVGSTIVCYEVDEL